jgi:hypothetical protein
MIEKSIVPKYQTDVRGHFIGATPVRAQHLDIMYKKVGNIMSEEGNGRKRSCRRMRNSEAEWMRRSGGEEMRKMPARHWRGQESGEREKAREKRAENARVRWQRSCASMRLLAGQDSPSWNGDIQRGRKQERRGSERECGNGI